MRASRTLNMPLPINCLSRVGLTRSNFRNARKDHPSVTLALMPSAHNRKRTARTERLRRWAILSTGSYPAQLKSFSSSVELQVRAFCRGMEASLSDFVGPLLDERFSRAASSEFFRSRRIRCQQSPRVHSGTSCSTLLMASCFLTGPRLIPAISRRSIAGRSLALIFARVPARGNVLGMTTTLTVGRRGPPSPVAYTNGHTHQVRAQVSAPLAQLALR